MEGKRFQVFVSSTFLDLQEERAAVVGALLQMEAFPAGMELFPAADDDAWTLITRVIESSDYYLLVVGGKYGSIDPETELSFTEKEYDFAVEQGKPVMAFLHSDPDKIELGKSEKDKSAQDKLDEFRKKVESKKHVKYWSSSDDLAGKVALSFANFRQTYPAIGWIRGDVSTSAEALGEINELRKQLAEAEARSATGTPAPPPEAEGLAKGSDLVGFRYVASCRYRRPGDEPWETQDLALYLDADVTWDALFSCVGPEMLNEADEKAVRKKINGWLRQMFRVQATSEAREYLEEDGQSISYFQGGTIEIQDEDFGTLIVQLRALGLIDKSERNRSVKDKGTYWKLTPYGDQHLTTLRAIRRDGDAVDGPGLDTDDSEDGSAGESRGSKQNAAAVSKKPKAAKANRRTQAGAKKGKAKGDAAK